MKFYLLLFLEVFTVSVFGQTIENTRLGFKKESLSSQQTGLSVSPDGNLVAIAYNDQTISIFDLGANRFIKKIRNPLSNLFEIIIASDNKLALCNGNELVIIDWKTETTLSSFKIKNEILRVVYSASSHLLAVAQSEGVVTVVDMGTNLLKREIKSAYKGYVGALAINPNGQQLAMIVLSKSPITFSNRNVMIELFDVNTGKLVESYETAPAVLLIEYDLSGKYLVVKGWDFLSQHDAATLRQITYSKVPENFLKEGYYNSGYVYKDKLMITTHSNSFIVAEGVNTDHAKVIFSTQNYAGLLDKEVTSGFFLPKVKSVNQIYPLKNGKFLINWYFNNVSQIYDAESNSISSYFFTDSNGDFAVISKDGRIDGTPSAFSKLFWTTRKSSKRTPIESTFDKNFSPQLLTTIIVEKSSEFEAFELDEVILRIPVLEIISVNDVKIKEAEIIESSQKSIRLGVKVKENPKEVKELKLFHNGKFVMSVSGTGSSTYEFKVTLNNAYGVTNYLYMVASSQSGIDSEKVKLQVNYRNTTDVKPKLYLIAIGIDKYKNPKYHLNYAVADANGIETSFKEFSSTLFDKVISYSIKNEEATKPSIVNVFQEIRNKILEQDVLIFYYAGHGVVVQNNSKEEFYLIPYDVTQLYGTAEQLNEKAISASSLKEFAQSINAQKQLFILDACQSSGALEIFANRGVAEEKAIAQLARSTGAFWIASTGTNQYAIEFEKLGHGIFTHLLLNGIGGRADADMDGKLTVRELATYVENKVPELSQELKGAPQYPSSYSFGNDFPIIVYNK